MSDFKAKMYQIQFRLGLCPRPTSWIKGTYFQGEGRGGDGKGRGREGEGERRGGQGKIRGGQGTRPHPFTPPNPYFWIRHWQHTKPNLTLFSNVPRSSARNFH